MRNRLYSGAYPLVIITVFISVSAWASSYAAEFTADMVHEMGNTVSIGKIFVKGDNFRQEFSSAGRNHIMIVRKDKGVVWMLMPGQKMYMEVAGPASHAGRLPVMEQEPVSGFVEKKHLGEEEINGYMCDKYEFIYDDQSKGTMIQWKSKKLGSPIKMIMTGTSGKMSIEYRNIKETSLPESLFEVPQGYQRLKIPVMPGAGTPGTQR